MGLRAGANKATAKRQPFSDFKKKTAKVGRKVKGGNVTKIEVTSKRIQIPLQSQITAVKPENEQENLALLLKTLQHYSGPARTSALEDLKELLAASPSTESYLSLIFPPALELLFDDERDTRKALISLLTDLLKRYPSNSFLSIVPVTITYICSGLTSLNKGVRRDALSLLLAIANLHSHILIPYLEKLVSHVLALLIDPGQAGGQDSLGTTSTTTFASSGGAVSKAKLDDSWKKSGTATRKVGADVKPSTNSRPPLLVAVLEVIDAILTSASRASESNSVCSDDISADSLVNVAATSNSQLKQAIILRPIRRSSLIHKAGRMAVKSIGGRAVQDDVDNLLSATVITALCHRLKSIWRGLVLDSSIVAAHTVDVLILVARVSYRLGKTFQCLEQQEFKSMVTTMFHKFPHSSLEASLSAPGSSRERSSDLKISTMDLYLCDVALSFYENDIIDNIMEVDVNTLDMSHIHSKVNIYLMQKLQLYVEDTIRQLARKSNSQKLDEGSNAMEIENQNEIEEELGDNNGKNKETIIRKLKNSEIDESEQELQTFTTNYSNISVRLFHALEIVTLAAGRKELMKRNAGAEVVCSDHNIDWSMGSLLIMLKQLMEAFVSTSTLATTSSTSMSMSLGVEMIKYSRRSLLAAVEPTLKCLFHLASDTALWSGGYPQDSFSPLAEALTVVSTLIQATDSADSTTSSSSSSSGPVSAFRAELSELGESYAYALLSIVRRVTPYTEESQQQDNKAINLLCSSIKALFEAPKCSNNMRSISFYHYSNTKTRFLLLDVFAHTPFTNVLSASKSVLSSLFSSSISGEEQKYFLRIAFERRSEMGASQFMDLLFQSLNTNISTRCYGLENVLTGNDVVLNTIAIKRIKELCYRWIVYDIADVIVWCSSSDTPDKILKFVESNLTTLAAPAIEGLNENKNNNDNKNKMAGINIDMNMNISNGMKKRRKGWIGQYASSVGTIAMCSRLLTPLLDNLDIDMDSPIICNIISLLSQACLSILSLCGSFLVGISESDDGRVIPKGQVKGQKQKTVVVALNGNQLIGPLIDSLCLRRKPLKFPVTSFVSTDESMIDNKEGETNIDEEVLKSANQSYFVFKYLVALLKSCWGDLSVQQCTNVEYSIIAISKISNVEKAVTMRIVCSEEFESILAFMSSHKRNEDNM